MVCMECDRPEDCAKIPPKMLVLSLMTLTMLNAGPSGQLAFVSGSAHGGRCLSVVDLNTGVVDRVGLGAADGAPVWSPDGTWIAFTSNAPSGRGIHIVRADGSEHRALPHALPWNRWPRWSLDGAKLAYTASDPDAVLSAARAAESPGGGNEDPAADIGAAVGCIMVYDPATAIETPWAGGRHGLMRPVWIRASTLRDLLRAQSKPDADGLDINLEAAGENGSGLMVAIGLTRAEGKRSTDMFLITKDVATPIPASVMPSPDPYEEWAPEPNPKFETFAFESNDGGDREIFVFTTKGPADVTNHHAADWNPVWSPDGKWLAFESFRSGRRGIFRVYPDTARVFPVAVSPGSDNWHPAWSPDGRWLAFVSNRTGNPDIYVTDAEGHEVMRVVSDPGEDLAPAWRPEPRQ